MFVADFFVADFYVDRDVSNDAVIKAFAGALRIDRASIQVWPQGEVDDRSTAVIVQHGREAGDFPILLRLSVAEEIGVRAVQDLIGLAQSLARSLQAPLITDAVGVNPLFDGDWLLVAPSGATAVVSENVEDLDGDESAIVLVPESRAIYESLVHHPLVASR